MHWAWSLHACCAYHRHGSGALDRGRSCDGGEPETGDDDGHDDAVTAAPAVAVVAAVAEVLLDDGVDDDVRMIATSVGHCNVIFDRVVRSLKADALIEIVVVAGAYEPLV